MTRSDFPAVPLLLVALTATGPAAATEPVTSPPAEDTLATGAGPIGVRPIQHGTFVLEWEGRTIYVDPVGEAGAFRGSDPPDLILVTDIHGDHLSVETVQAIATPETTIVVPQAVIERFPEEERWRLTPLANGASLRRHGITIQAIPMYNLTPERADFHVKGRGNGYVIGLGGSRIYVSGDTEDIPEMRGLEGIDAAFVCMNLPYTMDVEAAADAVLEFRPRIVYPYHYRGRPEVSDIGRFRELVAANPAIEVRLLRWY